MKSILYIFIICLPLFIPGQARQKTNPRITLRGHFGIPRVIGSQMFRTGFNGVVEGGLSANARLFENVFAGLGYQYSNFVNNKQLFAYYKVKQGSLSYNTHLVAHSGFLKLGFDKFFSDIGYASYSINAGNMMAGYEQVNPDTSLANRPYVTQKFNTFYMQPEITAHFMADKHVSFSILLSYTLLFYKFDPKAPRFYHVQEIYEARNNSLMSWLNIGFGFNILLGK